MATDILAAKAPIFDYLAQLTGDSDDLIASVIDICDGLKVVAAAGGRADGFEIRDNTLPGLLQLACAMLDRVQVLRKAPDHSEVQHER